MAILLVPKGAFGGESLSFARGEALQAAVGLGISASLTVLRSPREDVIPNDPDPLVEERSLGVRLGERLKANAHWITPEAQAIGKELIDKAEGLVKVGGCVELGNVLGTWHELQDGPRAGFK